MAFLDRTQTSLSPDTSRILEEYIDNATQEGIRASKKMTRAQAFSLFIGSAGVQHGSEIDKTHVLIYQDEETGRSNYQTVATPCHAQSLPFTLTPQDGYEIISDKKSRFPDTEVHRHAIISEASSFYHSRVDAAFNDVPTAIIASPRSACAAGCNGCSRGAIKSFTKPPREYIQDHVDELARHFEEQNWERRDLRSVSITTGSQPTEEKEVDMMCEIMQQYRGAGFENAEFMIYNYAIVSLDAMKKVRDAGARGYIGTIETMNDFLRRQYWGKVKGGQSFEDHLARYEKAREAGFDIVETNYVVGLDPLEDMMGGISRLHEAGVPVVPNVMRTYGPEQITKIHPDLWREGFRGYTVNAFDACIETYSAGNTVKGFAGEETIKYLRRQKDSKRRLGRAAITGDYHDLPIRHT